MRRRIAAALAAASAMTLATATTATASHGFDIDVEIEATRVVTMTYNPAWLDPWESQGLYVTQVCHDWPDGLVEDWTHIDLMHAHVRLYQKGELVASAIAPVWCYWGMDGLVQRAQPLEWMVREGKGGLKPGLTTAVVETHQQLVIWDQDLQNYEVVSAGDTDQVTFRLRKARPN